MVINKVVYELNTHFDFNLYNVYFKQYAYCYIYGDIQCTHLQEFNFICLKKSANFSISQFNINLMNLLHGVWLPLLQVSGSIRGYTQELT